MQTAKALPQEGARPNMRYVSEILNLRTVLFRPLWTHQRSTEE